jgi:hypothetical protein
VTIITAADSTSAPFEAAFYFVAAALESARTVAKKGLTPCAPSLTASPEDHQEIESPETRVTALERALLLLGGLFVLDAGVTEVRLRKQRRSRR